MKPASKKPYFQTKNFEIKPVDYDIIIVTSLSKKKSNQTINFPQMKKKKKKWKRSLTIK
jgi:hypothetical protein